MRRPLLAPCARRQGVFCDTMSHIHKIDERQLHLLLDLVDEVELDAMTRKLEDHSFRIFFALEPRVVVGLAFNFYVAVISKATSHVHWHDSSFDRTPHAMRLRPVWNLWGPRYTAVHGIEGLDLVIDMCGAHPSRPCLLLGIIAEVTTPGWVRKWWVQAVEMPIQWTVVARNDVSTTESRLAAGVAENRITFDVSSSFVVWVVIMIIVDPAALSVMMLARMRYDNHLSHVTYIGLCSAAATYSPSDPVLMSL